MKKIGLMIVALCLSLSVAASASSIGDQKPASRSKTEQPKNQRPSSKGKAVRGDQANLIAQLKQEHQVAMNELQEIRRIAAEEKAAKTLSALDKLMTRRNQEFEQRLQKLEAQSKGGEKDKAADNKAKGGDDKGNQKQNTGKTRTRG